MAGNRIWGNIFNVTRKENERQPDATGTFKMSKEMLAELNAAPTNVDGDVELEFAAWTKVGPKAGQFLSGGLSLKRGMRRDAPSPAIPPKRLAEEDPIPF